MKEYRIEEQSVDDISLLEPEATYSYSDYLKWTFEERVELIEGKIFHMSPAPRRIHQEIDVRFLAKIYNFLEGQKCKVYTAPFDVRFPKDPADPDDKIYTVVQPDICVICDRKKLDDAGCKGAPDLIVEILSPHTKKKDLTNKYELYEEHKVGEYWVVFPEERGVEIFDLKGEKFITRGKFPEIQVVHSNVLKGFALNLTEVFEGIT